MALFAPSDQFLSAPPAAPSRKRSQRFQRPRDDVDEFLSSDLELSFASTMSLHSPPHAPTIQTPNNGRSNLMDVSPALTNPVFTLAPPKDNDAAKSKSRPRAFTSGSRTFGRDVSNSASPILQLPLIPTGSTSNKHTQRSALPFEWMAAPPAKPLKDMHSKNLFAPHQSPQAADDAMDVDTIVPGSFTKINAPASPSLPAVPTVTSFNNLFYDTMSPRRSSSDSPVAPLPKKRRSLSPESVRSQQRSADDVVSSSPVPAESSPSQRKLERISSGPLLSAFSKPTLQGLGAPSSSNKRPHRPVLSATVEASHFKSAFPVLTSQQGDPHPNGLPPPRRAFSAMLIPPGPEGSSDEGSFDGPDMSSPAQAYSKRQSAKTIRRCDGTEDFRPLTGATAMVLRDKEESPSAKFLSAGMPGFGDNEAHGKVLPCHRVREDGLMRIKPQTLDELLDGKYNKDIADFYVIDCRFDYEYNGGHIPGAININTTTGVEEFLLGSVLSKPKQSVSGDSMKKTILVFHCEFSVKRAPTFAKHLRSKDRAMNNHVYPKIYYPEVYILEGGYCQYFKGSSGRCQPSAYVTMDDPSHATSRREDLDQFRKAKFGRTKSYAYGDGVVKANMMSIAQQQPKRNTAPSGGSVQLFAAADAARTRRGTLTTLAEDGNTTAHSEDEDTDLGDSPCPPPTKATAFKGKRLIRAPFTRAETYGPTRMAY